MSRLSLRRSRPLLGLALIGLLLFAGGAWTTVQGQTVGGQDVGAGAFSRMGFDARGLAVGNALVAAPGTNVSPYYNPALLPEASAQRLSGSAAALAFDRQLQSLEFTTPLGPTAGVGLGLIHAGVRNIDGRNADGRHTETLSTDEFALSLAFGNRFMETLSVGVGFTLYQSDVVPDTNPVRGFGVDVGAAYRITDHLKVAGAVKDLLAKYEWDTSAVNGQSRTDRFPVRVLVGGSYTLLEDDLHLMAELESPWPSLNRALWAATDAFRIGSFPPRAVPGRKRGRRHLPPPRCGGGSGRPTGPWTFFRFGRGSTASAWAGSTASSPAPDLACGNKSASSTCA